jgi:membrane-bound serine protease (ClpP class)
MTRQLAIARRVLAGLVLAVATGCCAWAAAAEEKAARPAGDPVKSDPVKGDPAKGDDAARPRRQGRWIKIPLPIDNSSVSVVQRTIQRTMAAAHDERPVFVLEFAAPEGNADAGRGTGFTDALKLANFLVGDELGGATTVAYIPRSIKGHAVLAAIACEQILMSPTATIGDAGADEKTLNKTLLAAYEEKARARHTVPVAVALGMLDKSRQVFKIKTEADVQFAGPEQLPEIEKHHRILSKEPINHAGEPWQITGTEARGWGIVKLLADDRDDVVRQMQLSPGVAVGDPSGGESYHAKRIDLRGPINPRSVAAVMHSIDDEVRKGTNFICLLIDSPGGAPLESYRLADHLAELPRDKVRTVAYIRKEALGDAALVALGCDEIVMQPRAVLGGPGQYQMTPNEVQTYQNLLLRRDSPARQKLRSWSLWAAMFNPGLNVYRCQRLGDVDYFCDDELKSRQPLVDKGEKGPLWEKGERVTTPGEVLSLTGEAAQKFGLTSAIVENSTQFNQHYGLEADPVVVERGWVDALADFLSNKAMQTVLIFLGALGIYIELHAPGTGIGAFIAVLAFALFFWSGFLEGTAGWLEVTLFVTGCACLLTEIFVLPGFIIFGVGGGVLILSSIVLASQTFLFPQNAYQMAQLQSSLMALAIGMCGLIGSIWLLNHWLPRAPVFQHVFLSPPEGEEAEIISRREMLVDLDNLLGQTGVATTPLGPSGKARFGNHLVDVISTGEFISRDSQVVVAEVHGNRVVVRAAGSSAPG